MSTWQPIETAPKDKPILLWLSKKIDRNYTVSDLCDFLVIGFWQTGDWCSIETQDCGGWAVSIPDGWRIFALSS